jgi:hypothetical protein
MTDEQFLAWLGSQAAVRVVLVEAGASVAGVEVVRLLSDRAFSTATGVPYLPIIRGGITFDETLPLDGQPSLSTGSIEIDNADGERDTWLRDVWRNRGVEVFIGDARWPREQFRQIFAGTIDDIGARDQGVLNLALRDKLQRLNTPLSEATIGGEGVNKDVLLPHSFGEVFNVAPLLVDEAHHEYQVHDGPIEGVIEVRDNGMPVLFTATPATGKFRLAKSAAGQITASVQGAAGTGGYVNTVAGIVQRLATEYGTVEDRLTLADIDLANFAAFAAAHPQPVGIWIADRANVLAVCQQLAASVGAQLAMSRAGQLRLLKIDLPAAGAARRVSSDEMIDRTFKPGNRTEVRAGVRLGYARCWTVQQSLETGIPAAHRKLYEDEYLEATANDAAVAALYRLHGEPERVDTLLLEEADAKAEAARRLALWSVPRTLYPFGAFAPLMSLELGQPLTIIRDRFGMNAGVTGMVVGIKTDWTKRQVGVEVLV